MKLAKLSLAAILAAGAFSVANASSLEDSIKGVTLNGMLRVRFYNRDFDQGRDYNRWRTNGVFVFGVPVGENFTMVYRSSVQSDMRTDGNKIINNPKEIDKAIANNLLFLKYSNGPVAAIMGKIPMGSLPILSHDIATPTHGAGAVVSYNVGNGFTVAGVYADEVNIGPAESLLPVQYLGQDLGAVAVTYKNDMASVNAWYYTVTNAFDNIFTLQATVKPMAGLSIHADYSYFEPEDNFAKAVGYGDDKSMYNVNVAYAANGFSGKIGYAATSDDAGVAAVAYDSSIAAILPTANRYWIAEMQDTDAYYAKLAYNVDAKTNVYAGYAGIDDGTTANDDSDEYIVGAKYQYNKKLGFHVYYDVLDYDLNAPARDDENEFRFEARYNF